MTIPTQPPTRNVMGTVREAIHVFASVIDDIKTVAPERATEIDALSKRITDLENTITFIDTEIDSVMDIGKRILNEETLAKETKRKQKATAKSIRRERREQRANVDATKDDTHA